LLSRLDSADLHAGLTAAQRRFLFERWEAFAICVLDQKADHYMEVIFQEWLEKFPVPNYTSSDDPDEKEYIAGVIIKVGFNTNTDAWSPANRRRTAGNAKLFALDSVE
jgi:hypothetical protein